MRIDVMGVGFDSLTMDEAVARARDLMAERRVAYVVTPNPEIVMLCREDPAAMQAVQGADLVLPDGIGIEVPVDETTLRPVTVESPLPPDMEALFS